MSDAADSGSSGGDGADWIAGCPAPLRPHLARYLDGALSAPMTLMHLLIATEDPARVAATLAELEQAALDAAVVPRLRELSALLDENREGAVDVAAMLRMGADHSRAADDAADGIAAWASLFDRAVAAAPEASVALYSLGNPRLLDAATEEVVARMRDWGLFGDDRDLLEIGCGIGRFQAALAGAVRSVAGIDISAGMVETARRRCAGLGNVRLLHCSGRDLAPFPDASVDLVFAVDTFPYLVLSGGGLVERHVAEAARVLRPGGSFLVLNFSYRGDVQQDREDVDRLARAAGFTVERSGTGDFAIWDGTTFLLRRTNSR
ncbi:MAG TPA: methyltransferase domain-containing protein [Stellaceae bacterium]